MSRKNRKHRDYSATQQNRHTENSEAVQNKPDRQAVINSTPEREEKRNINRKRHNNGGAQKAAIRFLKFNRTHLFTGFFFAILAFLIYQLIKIMLPFFGALVIAVVTTITFYPFHIWICRKLNLNKTFSAAISALTATITLLVPIVLLATLLAKESRNLYPQTREWISAIAQSEKKIPIPKILKDNVDFDVADLMAEGVQKAQATVTAYAGKIIKDLFFLVVNFCLAVITMFMLFRDGNRFLRTVIDIIPLDPDYKGRIAQQLYTTTLSVVHGLLITAMIQGILGGIGYWIAGVPAPTFFGFLTTCSALIPFVGTGLVWVPLTITMFIWKGAFAGVFVFIWGAGLVATIDNFLKPYFIGRKANLPVSLLFLGLLGGMRVYGGIGLVLGPLLISCLLIFLKIYRENRNEKKDGVTTADTQPGVMIIKSRQQKN